MIRILIRHLPPTTNQETVEQLLDQAGLKGEGIIIERISVGKIGTTTKLEVPSTAYVLAPNEQIGIKLCKRLMVKDSAICCELAAVQRVPEKYAAKIDPQIGTWQSDSEYLKYEAS